MADSTLDRSPLTLGFEVLADATSQRALYSNVAGVWHSKEEFILEFYFRHGTSGVLLTRIALNPLHAERLATALTQHVTAHKKKSG
jgi:hypothetical protein